MPEPVERPTWEEFFGRALLLIPVDYALESWTQTFDRIEAACAALAADVHRGVDVLGAHVAPGVRSVRWVRHDDVLVFRCPSGASVWDAAPLCAGNQATDPALVRQFFDVVTNIALDVCTRLAWVSCEYWHADEWPYWRSGDLRELLDYVVSFDAWAVQRMLTGTNTVFDDDEGVHWYSVTRVKPAPDRSGEPQLR